MKLKKLVTTGKEANLYQMIGSKKEIEAVRAIARKASLHQDEDKIWSRQLHSPFLEYVYDKDMQDFINEEVQAQTDTELDLIARNQLSDAQQTKLIKILQAQELRARFGAIV